MNKLPNKIGNQEAMNELIDQLEAKVSRLDREIEWCKLGAWAGFSLGVSQLIKERDETKRLIQQLRS